MEALTAAAADDGAFVVELPYPPSVNHYWRRVGDRTLISREGRKFRSGSAPDSPGERPSPCRAG